MNFAFQNPELLWLLLLLPVAAFLYAGRGRAGSLVFPSASLARKLGRPERLGRRRLLVGLRLLTLGLIIIGLARPRLGQGHSELDAAGIDIVLAVDLSGSMQALDFSKDLRNLTVETAKSRLDVAREVLAAFIQKRVHDRIALIAFGEAPWLVSPLTLNHDWLEKNLGRLQQGLIGGDGTAIGDAIAMGVNRLRDQAGRSRVIILLTDGANNMGKLPPQVAAEAAAACRVKVYTVGIGRSDKVPFALRDNRGRMLVGQNGKIIAEWGEVPFEKEALEKIAQTTGAIYRQAENLQQLQAIYDEIDQLEKTEIHLRHYASWKELFFWVVIPALLFLLLETILASTRWRTLP